MSRLLNTFGAGLACEGAFQIFGFSFLILILILLLIRMREGDEIKIKIKIKIRIGIGSQIKRGTQPSENAPGL